MDYIIDQVDFLLLCLDNCADVCYQCCTHVVFMMLMLCLFSPHESVIHCSAGVCVLVCLCVLLSEFCPQSSSITDEPCLCMY